MSRMPKQRQDAVTTVDEGMVAPDGLWLTRRAFAPTLTPKGDCIKVHKGYIFVTRYQGGMDNRRVCLSRKKIGGEEWQHIEFQHRHVMFRRDKDLPQDEKRGDAHNAIAIGICPKDDTIHLLCDMHAYTPADFLTDYFNYSRSVKGAATVPDQEWTIDLFHPKQNYLSKEAATRDPEAYHRVTYPGFIATPEGDLLAKWRIGGHTAAWMHFSTYDGNSWSAPWKWNDPPQERVTGFYGDLFRSRTKTNNRFHDYIYHNIGDALTLRTGTGAALSLTPDAQTDAEYETYKYKDWKRFTSKPMTPGLTSKRYLLLFPGWHAFTKIACSEGVSESIVGRFDLTIGDKRHMHVVMPGGIEREYTAAQAPPILEGAGGYDKKDSQVLSIRQKGEAWKRPFIVVFEPSTDVVPTVQGVENIVDGETVVGAKVVSKVGDRTITDRIIAQEYPNARYANKAEQVQFNGRFAIVRTTDGPGGHQVDLYVGDGETLSFQGHELVAGGKRNGYRSVPGAK